MARTVTLSLPAGSTIHLPVHWSSGIALDKSMPVGARYPDDAQSAQLIYQFVLAEKEDGSCVEVSARTEKELEGPDFGGGVSAGLIKRHRCSVSVERTQEGFTLAFSSPTDAEPSVRNVSSMEAAVADHCEWLHKTYNILTLAERIESGDQPAWVTDVPLVITFDLWRPSREVAHTYTHLRDLAKELRRLGAPAGTLFYLTGWCGPFDAWYPSYQPTQELGGRKAFEHALEAVHDAGFRVMAHVHPRDADPYRPSVEKLLPLAVRRYPESPDPIPPRKPAHLLAPPPPEAPLPPIEHSHLNTPLRPKSMIPPAPPEDPLRGPYWGWPGGGEREWLGFDSGKVALKDLSPTAEGWVFESVEVPKSCEAVFTIGGLSGVEHGTLRVSVNGRSLLSPGGWFLDNDSYAFPFTLMFHPGINHVEIACYGWPSNRGGISYGPPPNLAGAWYRLSQTYHHPSSWTSPKIAMDTDSPEWHEANTRLLSESVEEFRIDGVHVDSTVLWKWDERGLFPYLKRRLPAGTVFGTEVASAQSLGFFAFCQTRPKDAPPLSGWKPRRSDLPWQISQRYQRYYLHLCAPGGFVPVGSACSVDPVQASLTAEEIRQSEDLLQLSREHNMLYTLRVNYRDYGLDDGTRRFLLENVIKG